MISITRGPMRHRLSLVVEALLSILDAVICLASITMLYSDLTFSFILWESKRNVKKAEKKKHS